MEVKPGWKTTEFWFSIVAAVVGFMFAAGVIEPGGAWDRVLGLIASALVALGYTVKRSTVKEVATSANALTAAPAKKR